MATAPREVWGDLAATAFIEASHLFKSLDAEARHDLLQVATLVSFAPGEPISAAGNEGFYLLVAGTAAVRAPGAGEGGEVAQLERGACFGEARVLGAGDPGVLVAAGDVTVVAFPAAVIAAISERFPKVRRLLEAVRAGREREAAQKRLA
jgi:signal-transduction protein with cAMP-binding, CBS, and nucleotidyltransferase domain